LSSSRQMLPMMLRELLIERALFGTAAVQTSECSQQYTNRRMNLLTRAVYASPDSNVCAKAVDASPDSNVCAIGHCMASPEVQLLGSQSQGSLAAGRTRRKAREAAGKITAVHQQLGWASIWFDLPRCPPDLQPRHVAHAAPLSCCCCSPLV
jgi:hypothetical protein